MKLKCFIAMALGHRDTDNVYDQLISPTLHKLNVTSTRIDRIDYNDDIDDKILLEIKGCDFLIADLSYARPSVYFEAGYAQRVTPVIYTCRNDHLSRKENDKYGNFCVHFDLQMKNIIPWQNENDKKFSKKLKKRILYIIKPLLMAKKKAQFQNNDAKHFAALSLYNKTTNIYDICVQKLRHKSYSEINAKKHIPIDSMTKLWIGRKFKNGVLKIVIIFINDSLTKKLLQILDRIILPFSGYDSGLTNKKITRIIENVFLLTLKKKSLTQISNCYPDMNLNKEEKQFFCDVRRKINIFNKRNIIWKKNIHLIDNIKSKVSFEQIFSEKIKRFCL